MTPRLETVYLPDKSEFSSFISSALTERGIQVVDFDHSTEQIETINGVVIFHENHNFDKRSAELRDLFELRQVPVHKVDMSGTMNVALTHLSLFLERIKGTAVLFLGADMLVQNPKLELFREKFSL